MAIDLIAAGFPCQDLSVAGKRAGLAGDRSGLFWELVRVLELERPRWILIENVPGLLSSNGGRDFALVLHSLDRLRYGVAWRILDARYFELAQQRRRVWIVGHLGRPCPVSVLFESQGCTRDSKKSRKAGTDIAHALGACASPSGRYDPNGETYIAGTIGGGSSKSHSPGKSACDAEVLVIHENISGQSTAADHARALRSGASHSYQFVAYALRSRSHPNSNAPGRGGEDDFNIVCAAPDSNGVRETSGIPRQLDPPDGPRYKVLGNAVPVPVVEWIGRRIMESDALTRRGEGGE